MVIKVMVRSRAYMTQWKLVYFKIFFKIIAHKTIPNIDLERMRL